MSTLLKIVLAFFGALLVGLVVGFFVGRFATERQWNDPYSTSVAPAADSDPAPKPGTRILKPMPIGRARSALVAMTAKDPVVVPVASIGSGEDGNEAHVTIENRGTCKITAASGVVYGFGARGLPAALNKSGEQYLAFSLTEPIEPGKRAVASQKVRFGELATLAVAHVDATTCADGTEWKRAR